MDSKSKNNLIIGTYRLLNQYGGFQLCKMANDGGRITAITQGFVSKREIADLMMVFINGLIEGKSND